MLHCDKIYICVKYDFVKYCVLSFNILTFDIVSYKMLHFDIVCLKMLHCDIVNSLFKMLYCVLSVTLLKK